MNKNPLIKGNVLIVLRSCSGAGKSTFAEYLEYLCAGNLDSVTCCADDYFEVDGEYKFDFTKLDQAHKWCRDKAKQAMDVETKMVIIANTNTSRRDYKDYVSYAEKRGYVIRELVLTNPQRSKNVHNVPADVLVKQENRLRMNLQL
jgi:predicted kinase